MAASSNRPNRSRAEGDPGSRPSLQYYGSFIAISTEPLLMYLSMADSLIRIFFMAVNPSWHVIEEAAVSGERI
jgi:hypothetical protein